MDGWGESRFGQDVCEWRMVGAGFLVEELKSAQGQMRM